jgi:tetratricopeptide (TPR) repeat protein
LPLALEHNRPAMKSKAFLLLCAAACFVFVPTHRSKACKWDSTTLYTEKKRHPDLVAVVFGKTSSPEDPKLLRARIDKLLATRRENDPIWWDDLAVARMNLGELKESVALLESVTNRFADDYGIHANLGTAYHLLGRYPEAEREIARDLQINPNAHFGLEKYHLALLKYLNQPREYQSNHVYIDSYTDAFFNGGPHGLLYGFSSVYSRKSGPETTIETAIHTLENETNTYFDHTNNLNELKQRAGDLYFQFQWGLVHDTNFVEGVLYMASLNPKEPACFTMLGIACLHGRFDWNLAAVSFQRAIDLGSPQKETLQKQILAIKQFKEHSRLVLFLSILAYGLPAVLIVWVFFKLTSKPAKQT